MRDSEIEASPAGRASMVERPRGVSAPEGERSPRRSMRMFTEERAKIGLPAESDLVVDPMR